MTSNTLLRCLIGLETELEYEIGSISSKEVRLRILVASYIEVVGLVSELFAGVEEFGFCDLLVGEINLQFGVESWITEPVLEREIMPLTQCELIEGIAFNPFIRWGAGVEISGFVRIGTVSRKVKPVKVSLDVLAILQVKCSITLPLVIFIVRIDCRSHHH